MQLSRGEFCKHFISRSGPSICRLDCFLWGCIKAYTYTDKPASISALENNIEAFIREIPPEMLERVCQKWAKRMDNLRRSRGQRLHEKIFKH